MSFFIECDLSIKGLQILWKDFLSSRGGESPFKQVPFWWVLHMTALHGSGNILAFRIRDTKLRGDYIKVLKSVIWKLKFEFRINIILHIYKILISPLNK